MRAETQRPGGKDKAPSGTAAARGTATVVRGDGTGSASAVTRTGLVVEKASKRSLAGAHVRWTIGDATHADRGTELGSADTDTNGYFVITLSGDPEIQRAYRCLDCEPDAQAWLTAEGIKPVPDPGPAQSVQLVLAADPKAKPSQPQWQALADALMAQRTLDLGSLYDALSQRSPAGTGEWPLATRAAALAALTAAAGKAQARGASPTSVLDMEKLSRGDLAGALLPARDWLGGRDTIGLLPRLPKSDDELYRDYLRGIWVAAAAKMYRDEESMFAGVPSAALETQLDERFHQDFHTSDTFARPAAQLLIPLLTAVLTADAGREGFGLDAAAIPAQGAASDDEYLQTLIGLTRVDAAELSNRFRVSFQRPPGAQVSPVGLNVEALLGLLRDTFQSQREPFPALPHVNGTSEPIVFGHWLGHAPFFLEYDEWLERQRPFFPENAYDIRQVLPTFDDAFTGLVKRNWASGQTLSSNGLFTNTHDLGRAATWVASVFPAVDTLRQALSAFDLQNYPDATAKLDVASAQLENVAVSYDREHWLVDTFHYDWPTPGAAPTDDRVSAAGRAGLNVRNLGELAIFEAFFNPRGNTSTNYWEYQEVIIAWARASLIYAVDYLALVFIPYVRAQIAFVQGNFAAAIELLAPLTVYLVGVGLATDTSPYADTPYYGPVFFEQTPLPYTVAVSYDKTGSVVPSGPPHLERTDENNAPIHQTQLAPFEQRFFQLFQGEIMLALADALYRADTLGQTARARELYKGVIFMHGEDPGISPRFPQGGLDLAGRIPAPDPLWRFSDNPAKVSQLARARLGFLQIEQGLNAYGYADDMTPLLRYTPLKQAADMFAQGAKSAQNDYLTYLTRFEQAQIELWQSEAMVKKADAATKITGEQAAIAADGVAKAQAQVAVVQQQIAAKEAEIADKDSLWSQFSDYLGGVKDSLRGMVPLAQKVIADDGGAAGGSVSVGDLAGIVSKGFSGGTSASEDAAAATLGSGAAFMIGYGAFVYASYQSMSAMTDAANKRNADLQTLRTTTLAAAQAQVTLRQRDVTIAQQQQVIAQADLELGQQLVRFQQDRFLSVELWNRLSLFANRLMRRYVDLGARTAWFAERALAFEQHREIHVIRLDYWPVSMRGLTGADTLLADLAELEANRLQGLRLSVPVKHTISLAREFPLAFGQLKATGTCRFTTDESMLRAAYPGTYGYRIRALTVAADNPDGPPPRGILRNYGVSTVGAEDGSISPLVRFADALPLSEFRLRDDLFVYGLPGETLLQFEGSGFSTEWELELPLRANPQGLRPLADVLISFDMNASWSGTPMAAGAELQSGAIMLAASIWDTAGLAQLRDPAQATATLTVDPSRLQLPAATMPRKLSNIAVIFVGQTTRDYELTMTATSSGKNPTAAVTGGLALSNSGGLLGTAAPLPLNALVGTTLDEPFTLKVDKKTGAAELARLYDLVCYFEFSS